MAPPVTKTTVKKTKAADAAQQRSKSLTTGFIPQQIRAVTGDRCPKKGFWRDVLDWQRMTMDLAQAAASG